MAKFLICKKDFTGMIKIYQKARPSWSNDDYEFFYEYDINPNDYRTSVVKRNFDFRQGVCYGIIDNCGLYYIGNYDGTPLSIEDAKSKNFDEKTEFKDIENCLWDEFKNECYDGSSRGTDYKIPCVCDDIEIYLSCSYRIVLDENEPEIVNGDDLKEIEFFEVIG